MVDPFAAFSDQEREFYLAYGQALGKWAELEFQFKLLFLHLTHLSPEIAEAVFFSSRSFLGRADMVAACVPFARTIPAGREYLLAALNKARAYSAARNSLAHDRHVFGPNTAPAVGYDRRIQSVAKGLLTVDQIRCATMNFFYLGHILAMSHGKGRLLRDPELSLAAHALLGPDPFEDEVDRTRVGDILVELARSPH